MSTFGERLRTERDRLGLSQDEFAALGGVKRGAQVNYEKGERSPDVAYLTAVAKGGVDVLYLVTGVRQHVAVRELTPEHAALIDNYEHADAKGKEAARRVLSALAQQKAA